MTWQIEGRNTLTQEWEVMPYQTEEDGPEFTTFAVEYMAETVLAHWREFCPGVEFRIRPLSADASKFRMVEVV